MPHHDTSGRAHSAPPRRSATRSVTHARPLDRTVSGAASRELDVQVSQDRARPLVTVAGELDVASAGLLTGIVDHVRRSRGRSRPTVSDLREVEIDLDLSAVTFADSHGLAPVLRRQARIVAASGPVHRVLGLLDAAELPPTVPAGAAPQS